MKFIAVIPARYKSSRFPGKPLVKIAGLPMIQWVYQQVAKVDILDDVVVATDDQRIFDRVKEFGGNVKLTSSHHRSGTDRIAEVAQQLECDVLVNVQGDEPLIKPEMIKSAMEPFLHDEDLQMSTLKKRIDNVTEINDPNVVKVVCDTEGFALYFSRHPVPFARNGEGVYYKHIGLYVYKKDFLLHYNQLEPTILEKTESLEQLRVLENGYKIKVVETILDSIGVDTPEDINKVEQVLQEGSIEYG